MGLPPRFADAFSPAVREQMKQMLTPEEYQFCEEAVDKAVAAMLFGDREALMDMEKTLNQLIAKLDKLIAEKGSTP